MKLPTDEDAGYIREQLSSGCGRMEHLLRGLLDTKGRIAEEVHATRKLGKTLRGGFSLFGLRQNSSREIQAIGRLLSGPRDAVSRQNTWKKVAWAEDVSAAAAIGTLLEQQTHSAARRPSPEAIDWCLERVAAARRNLEELPQECLTDRIVNGLAKLERRVMKRCHHLDYSGHEDFHDARKALKAYLGALEFLPDGMVSLDPMLAELPEQLGDENDLATLSKWLLEHGFTELFVPSLWVRLKECQDRLRMQVILEVLLLRPCSK